MNALNDKTTVQATTNRFVSIIVVDARRTHNIRVASFWMLCYFRFGRHLGLSNHSPQFHARVLSPAG